MSMDVQTSMRLPALLLTRADALIDKLHADPSLAMMGKMTRSKVLRLALSEGLQILEERYASTQYRRPRSTLARAHAPEDQDRSSHTPAPTISRASSHSTASAVPMEED